MAGTRYASFICICALIAFCTSAGPTTQPSSGVQSPTWYKQLPALPEAERTPQRDDDPELDMLEPELTSVRYPDRYHEFLLKTRVFESRFVGGGGTRSNGSNAFQVILRQPERKECFHDLLERAHLAGKLYALCGLHLIDRDAYEAAVKPYRDSKEPVSGLIGCLGGGYKVGDLIRRIDSGSLPRELQMR